MGRIFTVVPDATEQFLRVRMHSDAYRTGTTWALKPEASSLVFELEAVISLATKRGRGLGSRITSSPPLLATIVVWRLADTELELVGVDAQV